MRLKWIEKPATQDVVDKRWYLVDEDSDRCYGYVEDPGPHYLCFEARPYEGEQRCYLRLAPAQGYVEQAAMEKAEKERLEFREPSYPPAGLQTFPVPVAMQVKGMK